MAQDGLLDELRVAVLISRAGYRRSIRAWKVRLGIESVDTPFWVAIPILLTLVVFAHFAAWRLLSLVEIDRLQLGAALGFLALLAWNRTQDMRTAKDGLVQPDIAMLAMANVSAFGAAVAKEMGGIARLLISQTFLIVPMVSLAFHRAGEPNPVGRALWFGGAIVALDMVGRTGAVAQVAVVTRIPDDEPAHIRVGLAILLLVLGPAAFVAGLAWLVSSWAGDTGSIETFLLSPWPLAGAVLLAAVFLVYAHRRLRRLPADFWSLRLGSYQLRGLNYRGRSPIAKSDLVQLVRDRARLLDLIDDLASSLPLYLAPLVAGTVLFEFSADSVITLLPAVAVIVALFSLLSEDLDPVFSADADPILRQPFPPPDIRESIIRGRAPTAALLSYLFGLALVGALLASGVVDERVVAALLPVLVMAAATQAGFVVGGTAARPALTAQDGAVAEAEPVVSFANALANMLVAAAGMAAGALLFLTLGTPNLLTIAGLAVAGGAIVLVVAAPLSYWVFRSLQRSDNESVQEVAV